MDFTNVVYVVMMHGSLRHKRCIVLIFKMEDINNFVVNFITVSSKDADAIVDRWNSSYNQSMLQSMLKDTGAFKKRPAKSAFSMYCSEHRPSVQKQLPGANIGQIQKELGARWLALKRESPDQIDYYQSKAVHEDAQPRQSKKRQLKSTSSVKRDVELSDNESEHGYTNVGTIGNVGGESDRHQYNQQLQHSQQPQPINGVHSNNGSSGGDPGFIKYVTQRMNAATRAFPDKSKSEVIDYLKLRWDEKSVSQKASY